MQATERLFPDAPGIFRTAELLSAGRIVALPTETVYGLGADARDDSAVAAIFAAKGRPAHNPLIVHLPDADAARRLVHWPPEADALAARFWPGALTLVLPLRDGHGLSARVTAGLGTVALRVPAHPAAQALLRAFGGPLAAPSANPSGRISPTTADHVLAGLAGRIAAVLDGGPCPVGLESTIIALAPRPTLLRPGGIAAEAIEALLGQPLAQLPPAAPADQDGGHDGGPDAPPAPRITAPGQLASHYAPGAALRMNAQAARRGEVLLGFGPMGCDLNLSEAGDLDEAAANLFGHLHTLDGPGVTAIAVAPIPDQGLGRAINDRLRRAAAPRD